MLVVCKKPKAKVEKIADCLMENQTKENVWQPFFQALFSVCECKEVTELSALIIPSLFHLQIMCFAAFSLVSLVTAIVSIQLLRLGLVTHTTDGHTFQKEKKDILTLLALGDASVECLVCILSMIVCCRMQRYAKKNLFEKEIGTFHVQVLGQKDIAVVITKPPKRNKKTIVTDIWIKLQKNCW